MSAIPLKFRKRPASMSAGYYGFIIPRVYIKNGLIDPDCEYEVMLVPVPEK